MMSDAEILNGNNLQEPKQTFKEIIARFISGAARQTLQQTFYFELPHDGSAADLVLGCTVTHFRINEPKIAGENDRVLAIETSGVFVAHVWYAYNKGKDTEVLRCSANFYEQLMLEENLPHDGKPLSCSVSLEEGPLVKDASITGDGRIKLVIRTTFLAETLRESRMLVKVYDPESIEKD